MKIDFRSCGKSLIVIDWDGQGEPAMPQDPERAGFRFNGWWVTCEEGVVPFTEQWLSSRKCLRSSPVR